MVGHCYFRSKLSSKVDDVYVATCDNEIVDYMSKINGNSVMTSDNHERATERVAEALIKIEKKLKKKYDFIVMVQGDEPLTYPQMIDDCLNGLLLRKNN